MDIQLPEEILVPVLSRHIVHGIKKDWAYCPMALSASEVLNAFCDDDLATDYVEVEVEVTVVTLTVKHWTGFRWVVSAIHEYVPDGNARQFILEFDNGDYDHPTKMKELPTVVWRHSGLCECRSEQKPRDG